jgi:hypothetical protein
MTHETGRVPSVAQVADRLAIYDVLVTHARGVDRADGALLRSAYWPEADVAYGVFIGSAHAFCEFLPQAIRGYARTQHCLSNIAIEIDGTTARVETYVTAYHYREAPGGDREMIYFGRHLDRMEKRGDVWKIMHRRVVMEWNQNVAASVVWTGPGFDGLARGARAPDDPACAHFA